MKRVFFIIGIIIIIILVGILIFLVYASKSQKEAIFNKFNLGNGSAGDNPITEIVNTITGNTTEQSLRALRQLTTRQVIGASEVTGTASTTDPIVYFAEAGTGHIYSIDIVSGTEDRLSNTTIQTAQEAFITEGGEYAVVASEGNHEGKILTLITLPTNGHELSSLQISELARDFTLTSDNHILYTTISGNTLTARSFNIATKDTKTLFIVPFVAATVRFGEKSTDTAYVYPRTAEKLEGYLYKVIDGTLHRQPIGGFDLNALTSENVILYNQTTNGTYSSYLFNTKNDGYATLRNNVIAEKCSFASGEREIFCAVNQATDSTTPEKWYKGALTTNDSLWAIDTVTYQEQLLVTPKDTAGRDFDIYKLSANNNASRLYFINKLDSSLWIFDRTKSQSQ